MNLSARVRRLERDTALRPQAEPCAECGYQEGVPPRYTFKLVDTDEECRSEWCGTCGRQTVYAMEYDRKG